MLDRKKPLTAAGAMDLSNGGGRYDACEDSCLISQQARDIEVLDRNFSTFI